jgi:hypothetical protein
MCLRVVLVCVLSPTLVSPTLVDPRQERVIQRPCWVMRTHCFICNGHSSPHSSFGSLANYLRQPDDKSVSRIGLANPSNGHATVGIRIQEWSAFASLDQTSQWPVDTRFKSHRSIATSMIAPGFKPQRDSSESHYTAGARRSYGWLPDQ